MADLVPGQDRGAEQPADVPGSPYRSNRSSAEETAATGVATDHALRALTPDDAVPPENPKDIDRVIEPGEPGGGVADPEALRTSDAPAPAAGQPVVTEGTDGVR
jgi:hypothetical protein